ncbi:MAG TPA: hypothetical protein V6D08_07985 [Candidatus Obscuribacterales bacterium]
MSNRVEIAPEIVRLAQRRARSVGAAFGLELARLVVEESILRMDPDEGWLLDSGDAYAADDAMVQALGVNDVVVNGCHLDVRVLEADGSVRIAAALAGTSYLSWGSVVVRLEGGGAGAIVGHVSAAAWQQAERLGGADPMVRVQVTVPCEADLKEVFAGLSSQAVPGMPETAGKRPDRHELAAFVAQRQDIEIARQREIVEMLMNNPELREELADVTRLWSQGTLSRILSAAAVWNSRVERIVDALTPKFASLKREDVRRVVLRTGEALGGQPESPYFRKALLSSLAREELVRRVKGADIAKLALVVEKVLSGRSAEDTVKGFVKNRVAIDVALAVKQGRSKMEGFMAATAEEIGAAFQRLSLQPAYATHSKESEAGVESINEALQMLEAGDVAEQIRQIDKELSGI